MQAYILICMLVQIANLARLVAIHFRPSFSATTAVVPEPTKKSQGLEKSLIILSSKDHSSASPSNVALKSSSVSAVSNKPTSNPL